MPDDLHALACASIHAITFAHRTRLRASNLSMEKDWVQRLQKAIRADGRSARAISVAAGLGVNYVQQFLKDGKEPGSDRLARLLDVLGKQSSLYVLTGISASEDDLRFLAVASRIRPEVRDQALSVLEALQDRTEVEEPPLGVPPEATAR